MNIFRKIITTASLMLLGFFYVQTAEAQIGTYQRLELGIGLGATQYTGDLNNSPTALGNTRWGAEFHCRYNFTTYFAGRGFFALGALAGSSENSDISNSAQYSFKSNYYNFGAIFEYNFFNFRGIRESYKFSPYVFAGIGGANFTITKYINDAFLTDEGSGITPMIPFGIGVKKGLTRRINLGIEFQSMKLFTDNVDGLETEPDGGSNFPNFQGVNPKKDMAYFFNISLSYRFITIRCPESSLDYAGEK